MKSKLTMFIIALIFMGTQSKAQKSASSIWHKKNETGVALRFPSSSSTEKTGAELLYKRWFRPWQAYRVSAGVQVEENHSYSEYRSVDNQVIQKTRLNKHRYSTIGGGIEAQRQFYKRVYLFAAVDIRFLLGTGNYQTKEYKHLDSAGVTVVHSMPDRTESLNARIFKWELTPSIGAKFNFNRISFGVEVFNANISYTITNSSTKDLDYNLFDLDLGNSSNRLFLAYRF